MSRQIATSSTMSGARPKRSVKKASSCLQCCCRPDDHVAYVGVFEVGSDLRAYLAARHQPSAALLNHEHDVGELRLCRPRIGSAIGLRHVRVGLGHP